MPYTGADYNSDVYTGPTDARPPVAFTPGEEQDYPAEPAPLPWYKRPPLLFGAAAVAALLAVGGLAITLTGNSGVLGPVTETSTTFSIGPSNQSTSVAPADRHRDRIQRRADHHRRHTATAPAVVVDDHNDDHDADNELDNDDHHHHNDDHHHHHDDDHHHHDDHDVTAGAEAPT